MTSNLLRMLIPVTIAFAGTIVQATVPLTPRIVVQFDIQPGVEVAAWTPDDRYVVTGLGVTRTLTIWDAATGIVVDRANIPALSTTGYEEFLRLTSIDISPDGRTATVYAVASPVNDRAGAASPRAYAVDLSTRIVRTAAPRPLPAGTEGLSGFSARIAALTAFYEGDPTMTPTAAEAQLPMLPRAHKSALSLRRTSRALQIVGPQGVVQSLGGKTGIGYSDAALSSDGRHLLLLTDQDVGSGGRVGSSIVRFDMASGRTDTPLHYDANYTNVAWLDGASFLLRSEGQSIDREDDTDPDNRGAPIPALVVDAASSAATSIPARCYIHSLGGGRFVGADLANCRTRVGAGRGIAIYDRALRAWTPLAVPVLKGRLIDDLAVSPVGPAIALIVVDAKEQYEVLVVDRTTGAPIDVLSYPPGQGIVTALSFTTDGSQLIVAANGGAAAWKYGSGNPRVIKVATTVPQLFAASGDTIISSGAASDTIARGALLTGEPLPLLDFGNAIAGGFLPGKPVFWAASATNGLRLWDTRDWHVILTTYQFDASHFLTVTPDGQYDTNLGPDSSLFRWIVPDAPFQSLSPQTFMRDYFVPRLGKRLFDCTVAGNCATAFHRVAPIASLNRVLPQVKIVGVVPGDAPDNAIVRIEVREGVDLNAANGKLRSGIYNVRLFRNGRFVDQEPIEGNEILHPTIVEWREANAPTTPLGSNGAWQLSLRVSLPTAVGTEASDFSAYGFNEDRVKSDTTHFSYSRPAMTPRKPRAFIITVGIDAYDEDRLALSYAASDARLLGDRLAAIPGYDVRRLTLTGTKLPDGSTRRITKEVLRAALLTLSGKGEVPLIKTQLAGVDASHLDRASPDDIVILSFSGHGWANPQGDFFLVPTEGKWADDAALPDLDTLISSANLTTWLRGVDASEIAVVIDACHSGASVDSATFKPGPMGDAGLGQLAYDKGMRILAATQAADLAMEDASLHQGLLTYALASEGLDPVTPRADLNGDGRISLDEWLRYATQRLPQLSGDLRIGRFSAGASRGFNRISTTPAPPPKIQEPSLFDFTDMPSPVVLRQIRP